MCFFTLEDSFEQIEKIKNKPSEFFDYFVMSTLPVPPNNPEITPTALISLSSPKIWETDMQVVFSSALNTHEQNQTASVGIQYSKSFFDRFNVTAYAGTNYRNHIYDYRSENEEVTYTKRLSLNLNLYESKKKKLTFSLFAEDTHDDWDFTLDVFANAALSLDF